MKAMVLGGPATLANLGYVNRDARAPGPGEILVRVRASSLNFHDYLVAVGLIPAAPGRVLLSDGVGEVVECGPDATAFKVGDRVMGTFFPDWPDGHPDERHTARMRGDHVDGFASDYVVMRETDFTPAPRNLTDAEAATLPCAGLTAWRALVVEGGIKPGDNVLVEGSGGVSVFAIQFAKAAGATVIATTSTDEKAARLQAIGADHVINYTTIPKWGAAARNITGGRGVDHVVEVVGGDLSQPMQALRVGGALYLVGALSRQPIEFPTALGIHGNRRIIGLTVGSRKHQLDMVRAVEANAIRPVLDRTFPLAELGDAFRHQEAKAHFGKISISI
ncbi:zinc-binding dehydrogenase [Niveispirillum sp. SYP-B3756]|uniref:zinc-dependent alcohol dehydrogenase family protein n=1 Tax=Niveispirillum sp. SYP-B3756 TaxID=2662178 RepID=UPI001290E812|nr:NAD(P)-dependent alcohol dehydrogenase [Niveispirillum sp. SYP-B3756]MQP68616.1 zinc-binding dehydrogenase [Niveispirillum sp. SYP-B3756]